MTNLEIACHLLGWQGGTIHQVAKITGLTVEQILESKDIETLLRSVANDILKGSPMPKGNYTAPSVTAPHYQHDCSLCHWLGDHQVGDRIYDLYFCSKGHPTIISRYSDEPGDCNSGLTFGIIRDPIPALREAMIRAVLIPEFRVLINEHVLRFEFSEHIEQYQEILQEAELRKVQKKIEAEALALIEKYKIPVTGQLAVEEMTDCELKTLVAYETWKDGAEWDHVESVRVGISRTDAIQQLAQIFGYTIGSTVKGL